ncbi:Large subunit GTPase 1-like protein [Acropora cervicornis]|uniref:Large subunit GTPase 1 homolog n=1 Tax=Acropora cervicornis TaxID=6130 RepID=A0AAD9UX79_ACRCE|nr:Large subunit GTPase 1-like protein [Acropora cervicornis]
MGKKNNPDLGKSIIRRRGKNKANIKHADSWLHYGELDSDTGAHNIQSITEQSDLDNFLATAQLAGTDFTAAPIRSTLKSLNTEPAVIPGGMTSMVQPLDVAINKPFKDRMRKKWQEWMLADQEKLNTKVVTAWHNEGLLSSEAEAAIKQAQHEYQDFLRIPRRPSWDEKTTATELDEMERESFLEWRRKLADDVIVQIVDARNPLLFRCEDLEKYVTEVDANKCNLVLINKADFLTAEQRHCWARYFKERELPVAFWSAKLENERLTALGEADNDTTEGQEMEVKEVNEEEESRDEQTETIALKLSEVAVEGDSGTGDPSHEQLDHVNSLVESHSHAMPTQKADELCRNIAKDCDPVSVTIDSSSDETLSQDDAEISTQTADEYSGRLLTKYELLTLCRRLHRQKYSKEDDANPLLTTVGYPNVGKSSTINALLNEKKVAVSVTPGRTKHFQRIPRNVLEAVYGINLTAPEEEEDPNRAPLSHELLSAYGYMRGFMTSHGVPDGKLLFCTAPPGEDETLFQQMGHKHQKLIEFESSKPQAKHVASKQGLHGIDKDFFNQEHVRVFARGVISSPMTRGVGASEATGSAVPYKPWKKHRKKDKKEKLRRLCNK